MGHGFPAILGHATQGVSSGNVSRLLPQPSQQWSKQANPVLPFSWEQNFDLAVAFPVSGQERNVDHR